MPYQKNGKRDYQRELIWDRAHAGRQQDREARHRARYGAIKAGLVEKGDNLQVDHIVPLSKGGSAKAKSNLRVVKASANESFKRNAKGGLVSQYSTKERSKNASKSHRQARRKAS